MSFSYTITDLIYAGHVAEFASYLNKDTQNDTTQAFSAFDENNDIIFDTRISHNIETNIVYKENSFTLFYKKEHINNITIIEMIIKGGSKEKIEELINDANKFHNKFLTLPENKIAIHYFLSNANYFTIRKKRNIGEIYVDNELKHNLLKDLEHFYNSKELYLKLKIPYRKIYLFHGNVQTIFDLALAYASNFNKTLCVCDYDTLDDIFMTSNIGEHNVLLIQNVYEQEEEYLVDGFTNGYYNLNGVAVFFNVSDMRKVPNHILKICDDIFEIKTLNEAIIKKIYRDITESTNEDANAFYHKVQNIKFDVMTLQQFLLKPKELQTIAELKKLAKAKQEEHNNMVM
jgi:hypothetical protein